MMLLLHNHFSHRVQGFLTDYLNPLCSARAKKQNSYPGGAPGPSLGYPDLVCGEVCVTDRLLYPPPVDVWYCVFVIMIDSVPTVPLTAGVRHKRVPLWLCARVFQHMLIAAHTVSVS
jgi:hypothetical protein